MKTYFNYENGKAICELRDKSNVFIGTAFCHPDDEDMMSERVGLYIAECRAWLELYRNRRDCAHAILVNLKHLWNNIKQNKDFNSNSNEARLIRRQLAMTEKAYAQLRQIVKEEQKSLTDYISNKDKLYQRIRSKENN